MKVAQNLLRMLADVKAQYEIIRHHSAKSSRLAAISEHVPTSEHAKAVILTADDRNIVMAVVPADRRVDIASLKKIIGCEKLHMEWEDRFKELFSDCEPGALPPFGELYHVPVYVDEALSKREHIVFKAGSHTESIRMKFKDYADIVRPRIGCFSCAEDKGEILEKGPQESLKKEKAKMKKQTSKKAGRQAARPIVTCSMCGKHVIEAIQIEYRGGVYCSPACADADKKETAAKK